MNKLLTSIRETALREPSRTAYAVRGGTLSYGELWQNAAQSADLLCRQDTSPVLVMGGKEPEMLTAMLACLMARRAYVPLRGDTPPARIADILRLTGATLLISEQAVNAADITVCRLSELTQFAARDKQPCDSGIAYIIFTSGSTGAPKGVPISIANLENFAGWISRLEPLRGYRHITVCNQASFSFDLSVADLYYALCNGHTLVATEDALPEHPQGVFRTLAQAEVAVMTPTFARLCLLYDTFCADSLPRLKCLYFCGEPLETATVRKLFAAFPSLHILNAYGPTEATSAVSAIRITPEMAQTMPLLPCGEMNTLATPLSIENGEIVLRGNSVFGGYLGDTVGGYFCENGVSGYRTGDGGHIENGMLFCTGRADRQIKYKGYRIELDDIEQNLAGIAGVTACAVIAKRNAAGSVRLIKAFAVTDGTVDEAAIRAELAQRLPSYMLPKSIVLTDSLPVNENGKTDRKGLESW